jgi:hypothetical protein
MNRVIFRLAAVCGILGAGVFCFHRFACNTLSEEHPEPHILPAAVGEYLDTYALRTKFREHTAMNYLRVQAKRAVVTELLADRLTLGEAAARFRELDADMPETRDRLVQHYPGVPYEVAMCRQVIEQARSVLRVRAPEQVERVVARLEAELEAHLECEAGLRLP